MHLYRYLNNFTTLFFLLVLVPFNRKVIFCKNGIALLSAILANATIFLVWASLFTQAANLSPNKDYLASASLYSLQLEEVLFYLAVPYVCIFNSGFLSAYTKQGLRQQPYTKGVAMPVLIAAFLSEAFYTSTAFCLLAIVRLVQLRLFCANYLARFYRVYRVYLPPLLLIIGTLTFIPVAWYNDSFHLSLAIFSSSIADTNYFMLMLLLIITVYERFKARKTVKQYEPVVV